MASGSEKAGVGKKTSNILMWILMVLLIAGLASFGGANLGGQISEVGSVGDTPLDVIEYQRGVDQEMRIQQQRTGQPVSLSAARNNGISALVLRNMAATAALAEETKAMGISVGDAEVARQLQQVPQFQGPDGSFDRDAYTFALDQNRITPSEFEDTLRVSAARSLLQQAVTGGLTQNDTYANTLYTFLGEQRSFRWATLSEDMLIGENETPGDAELKTYFEANSEQFMTPEKRRVTYAWLTPDMLLASIEVDDATLRDAYEARSAEFNQPERRLVERLGFSDTAAAEAAKAQLDAGEITFEDLVGERGLTLEDVDQGEVARRDLDGPIAEAVFALTEPGLTDPIDTSLGPAIYRVNAVLDATTRAFQDVREELLAEATLDRARRNIEDMIEEIDDLLVGGASLEELAEETEMELGNVDFSPEVSEGIAGYEEFRVEVSQITQDDFAEVRTLSDGGIFAVQLEEIIAPELPALDSIRADVLAAYDAQETRRRLTELGGSLRDQMTDGVAMEALGLSPKSETDITRNQFLEDAPRSLLQTVFAMEDSSSAALLSGGDGFAVVELTNISKPDLEGEEATDFRNNLNARASQALAADVFEQFGQAVQDRHGLTLNHVALDAVHNSTPQNYP